MIEAHRFGFSHRGTGRRQLQDVTCEIPAGSRVAVMGATGAGKSTLTMALNGLVPHHHPGDLYGQLRVAGMATHEASLPQLVRITGLVSQDPQAQVMERLVLDDAAAGPANLGLPRDEVVSRARRALAAVGLADLACRETTTLSGGQLQRLAIAGVLAMEPQLLVLDEPASALDPEGAAAVRSIIRTLSDAGNTIVLVEHDPDAVATWADLLLVLAGGRVSYFGPPGPFLRDAERMAAAGLRPAAGPRPRSPQAPRSTPPQASTRTPVLETIALTHRYPSGALALDSVDLAIYRGEFVALLGGNGAGKSTLARHFTGLLSPTSGTVRVGGSDAGGRDTGDLAGEVGFVFQNPDHQIFANTVFDEAAFGLRNTNVSQEQVAERVGQVLSQVGLGDAAGTHPLRLSRAERQRLAVASVLVRDPGILILDEPTTGQDWRDTQALMELVSGLHRAGATVVLITHDLQLAARYATRAVVLDEGRLALDIPMTRLFDDEARLAELHLAPTGPPGSQAPAPDPGEPPEPTGEPTLAQGRASLLSRADVRSKLLALAAAVAATLLASDPLANLILAAVTAGAVVTAGGSSVEGGSSGSGADGLRRLRGLLAPLLPVLFLVFAFAVLAPPPGADPDVVARLWPGALPVTAGGLRHAANLVLRLVAMVCGSAAVLASTPTEQFTTLMRTLRLPNALVFMCTTALRFVPTLRQRARQITDAQQVRGARISSGGLVRRIKAHATVMIPLLTSGIRMSEDLAAAMVSRGYGITRHPTRLHDLSWSWRDTLLAAAAIALLAVPLVTG